MALGFASTMSGPVISALVRTSETTVPPLVVFAVVQVVFRCCLFAPHGTAGVNQVSYLTPSRWAVAAAGATLDLDRIGPPQGAAGADPLWEHTAPAWTMDPAAVLVLGVLCGLPVSRVLRRHEPEVTRKRPPAPGQPRRAAPSYGVPPFGVAACRK
ncbi:hypothetical protein GCM10010259_51890 [Streptomyces daghestanicus]|uniref:Uncharacterized protein n=2 Tax=Streptomyces TaxID=1883 RepID=A0ABT9LBB0_STRGD|nr:hypothetical protein [Streptomyces griseoviridis]GGT10689.1 hypothetical protein GCM10010240_50210 [Streptomyces griseoviridis]GGU54146.1 hypothetical protein GCM10010259_51890 [Streptomyces daghestanicus]GHI28458.1 hypothetical protein Sdagh_01880 [Streptomyces daghestanicus]